MNLNFALSRPQDEDSFNSDFAAAFSKLLELGVPRPGMQPIMLPVLPYLFLRQFVCILHNSACGANRLFGRPTGTCF